MNQHLVRAWMCVSLSLFSVAGCEDSQPKPKISGSGSPAAPKQPPADTQQPQASPKADKASTPAAAPKRTLSKVQLGASRPDPADTRTASSAGRVADPAIRVRQVLRPLQMVLVGQWRGITNKTFEGFKSVSTVQWIWDHQTHKNQPALLMTSESSPYIRQARLTYLLDERQFQFMAEDKQGVQREYRGSFSAEPRDEPGDDNKLQRTYKLALTQVSGDIDKEAWQIVLNQQRNDRYLLELSRSRRGGDFVRFDTVGTQREGTSFAISDTDFKEKTCVISEGLGTIQVSHEGKSYWVCCSGCKAAFEEEPDAWLAKREAREAERAED